MIIYLDHPARPRSSASSPVMSSQTLSVEQKAPFCGPISLPKPSPNHDHVVSLRRHCVLFIPVKPLAEELGHGKNSAYVILHPHPHSPPPLYYYYPQG